MEEEVGVAYTGGAGGGMLYGWECLLDARGGGGELQHLSKWGYPDV